MEKLFKKRKNGRYESVGYGLPDVSDGIWLIQSRPSHRSMESLVWKVGDLKRPTDIVTHASLQAMSGDIIKYIQALSNIESPEYKEAFDICGGYLRGPINILNISASDLATLLLRQIAIKSEKI